MKTPVEGWQGLLRRGMASQIAGNVGWTAFGSIGNGLLGALSTAILARYLGIVDFGTFALILSLFNLMTDLSDAGLSSAVIRFGPEYLAKGDRSGFRNVVSIVLRYKLIISATVICGAILLLRPVIEHTFGHVDEHITQPFLLSLIAVFLNVFAGAFPSIFQAHKQFRLAALVGIMRSASKVLLLLACIPIITQWSVVIGVWIEITALAVFFLAGFFLSPLKSVNLLVRDATLQRRIFSFNKWIALYQVISLLGGRLDILFVGGLSDGHALGIYSAASRVAGMVMMVAYSYMAVMMPDLSSAGSEEALRRKQRNSLVVVGGMLAGIVLLALVAEPMMTMVFGEVFAEAATVLQIMCIGMVFTILGYPLLAAAFARGKSVLFPVMSVVALLAFIGANVYLIPKIGVTGAAIAFSFHGFVSFLIAGGFTLLERRRATHQVKDVTDPR
ncbi:MAG: flippase [Bacteroidota bacterium]